MRYSKNDFNYKYSTFITLIIFYIKTAKWNKKI